MSALLTFVRKEFLHIFRDRRTLLILFGMPVALVALFGFALTNEIRDADVAVLDFDHGPHARAARDRLLSSGYFRAGSWLGSYADVEEAFRQGHVKLAVVFPAGFSHDLTHQRRAQVQLVADASDQNTAISLVNYATAILMSYGQEVAPRPTPGQATPVIVEAVSRLYFNPELKAAYTFVPGTMALILMLVSAMLTSITIAREKELGTMEVLLVSPLRQPQIILGKIIPYFLLSFINAGVILALGVFALGMPVVGSLLLLLAESLLYIFTALALGVLISTRAATQQVAMLMSAFTLLLPSLILTGFIFPLESMPKVLRTISAVIPARYFIVIVKGIMLKGLGLHDLWRETLTMAGMAAFFLIVALRSLKDRLQVN